jgi:hypothetical protein
MADRIHTTVEVVDGYLEYKQNGRLIYDIEAERYFLHLPYLKQKNWFTNDLEELSERIINQINL